MRVGRHYNTDLLTQEHVMRSQDEVNMSVEFFKVVPVKDTTEGDNVIAQKGHYTDLLNYFAIAEDGDGEMISSKDIGLVTVHCVDCITADDDNVYTDKVQAFKDTNGDYWVDYEFLSVVMNM